MLQRMFLGAMRRGAFILFVAALVMLILGIAYSVIALSNADMSGPSLADQAGWIGAIMLVLPGSLAPAACLFFGALIVHHIGQRSRSGSTD